MKNIWAQISNRNYQYFKNAAADLKTNPEELAKAAIEMWIRIDQEEKHGAWSHPSHKTYNKIKKKGKR